MLNTGVNLSSRAKRFIGLPKKVTAFIDKESDRGTILILGAYVEEILGLIIFESCCSEKLGQVLLEFRNPGGDFASKILLCEAFGLISPDEARAADCLRKLRNSAAHFDQKGRGFDVLFDSQQTTQQVSTFLTFLNLKLTSRDPAATRSEFVIAARLLAMKLLLRLPNVHRAPVLKTLKEFANAWRARMKHTKIGRFISAAEREARGGKTEKLSKLMQLTSEVLKLAAQKASNTPPETGKKHKPERPGKKGGSH